MSDSTTKAFFMIPFQSAQPTHHLRLGLLLTLLALLLIADVAGSHAAEPADWSIAIETEDAGAATVRATLHLPYAPSLVYSVFTDYAGWPHLFADGFQIRTEPCESPCSIIADMLVPQGPLLDRSQLRAQAIEEPPTRLSLRLLDGDFRQYQLTWRFEPTAEGRKTRATLNLRVQPQSGLVEWVPDGLYRWALQAGLNEHFHRVDEETARRAQSASRP